MQKLIMGLPTLTEYGEEGDSMSKFTPGPWKVQDRFQYNQDEMHRYTITQHNGTNEIIAKTVKEYDSIDDEANARLIAQAPELFHHLRRMITCLGEHLEEEAEERGVPAGDLCPCLGELKAAQRVIYRVLERE